MPGRRVYDPAGVSVTLSGNGGGLGANTGLYAVDARFIDLNPSGEITEYARCIQARYQKGMTRHKRESSGVAIPVLTPGRAEKRQNGRRFKEDGEPMFTLTAQDRRGVAIYQRPHGYNKGGIHKDAPTITGNSYQENNVLLQNCRIRRLTPRECFRLQGFPDDYFDRAAAVCSDTQLYKQAGNSVTVNVIYEIARRLR